MSEAADAPPAERPTDAETDATTTRPCPCAICGQAAAGIHAPTGQSVCTACARAGIDPADIPAPEDFDPATDGLDQAASVQLDKRDQERPAVRYRVWCPDCEWTSPVRHIAHVVAKSQARLHDREAHDLAADAARDLAKTHARVQQLGSARRAHAAVHRQEGRR